MKPPVPPPPAKLKLYSGLVIFRPSSFHHRRLTLTYFTTSLRRVLPYKQASSRATKSFHSRLPPPPPTASVHPSCDSSNTSRRFALGASNVCLVGENPTCSVPVAMRGSLVIRLRPFTNFEYTPPPAASIHSACLFSTDTMRYTCTVFAVVLRVISR